MRHYRVEILAKIAEDLEHAVAARGTNGGSGAQSTRVLASGDGWSVHDVVCTCGPQDPVYEEQRSHAAIAVIAAGTFQYRSDLGHAVMTPGSLLLGNAGQCFECGHQHAAGDRCISFRFRPACFERIADDAGTRASFRVPRLPPIRETANLVARACAALRSADAETWEEIAILLAATALGLESRVSAGPGAPPRSATARVTDVVRYIESKPHLSLPLGTLAEMAGLSRYHFIRAFQRITGVTPHQYILRSRLREAALQLAAGSRKVIDVAYGCGFRDLSNFNRAFRAEFGVEPRRYRRAYGATLLRRDS